MEDISDIRSIRKSFEKELKQIRSEMEALKKEQQEVLSKWSEERLNELKRL